MPVAGVNLANHVHVIIAPLPKVLHVPSIPTVDIVEIKESFQGEALPEERMNVRHESLVLIAQRIIIYLGQAIEMEGLEQNSLLQVLGVFLEESNQLDVKRRIVFVSLNVVLGVVEVADIVFGSERRSSKAHLQFLYY